MTEPSDLELAERLEQIAVAITNRDNSELTMSIPPRPKRDYDIVLQFAAARLRQRSEDAELLDWAEHHPADAMGALSSLWAQLGRGSRESYMNWRFAIRDAARKAK